MLRKQKMVHLRPACWLGSPSTSSGSSSANFNPFEDGDAPKTEDGPPAAQPAGLVPPPPPPAPPAPTFNPFEDGDAPKTEDGPPAAQPAGLVPLHLLRLLQRQPLIHLRTEMLQK